MLSTFLSEYWPALVLIVIMLAVTWWLACICKESQLRDRLNQAYSEGREMGRRNGKLEGETAGYWRGKAAGKGEVCRYYRDFFEARTQIGELKARTHLN